MGDDVMKNSAGQPMDPMARVCLNERSKRARRVVSHRGVDVHNAPHLAGGHDAKRLLPDRIEQMVMSGTGDEASCTCEFQKLPGFVGVQGEGLFDIHVSAE